MKCLTEDKNNTNNRHTHTDTRTKTRTRPETIADGWRPLRKRSSSKGSVITGEILPAFSFRLAIKTVLEYLLQNTPWQVQARWVAIVLLWCFCHF